MSDLDEFEQEAVAALLAWLRARDYPMLTSDGHAMQWDSGRPIALDVLNAVNALKLNERLRDKVPA